MKDKFLQFLGIVKKSGSLLEGYNNCEAALGRKKIYMLILSNDCSDNTKNKFKNYSDKYSIELLENYSKEQLGGALGKEEINIIGITDENMYKKLVSLLKEEQLYNSGGESIVKD